ncbi:MAG: hypothetical protein ACRDH9_12160 [Actinomycetota bacterium]
MTHRFRALTLLPFIPLILLAACGGSPDGQAETRQKADERPLQLAYEGLCDAAALSEEGDAWGAANEFGSNTHAYLHELAASLSSIDRAAAARLLEAKERLESVINTPDEADPVELTRLLSDMREELGNAAVAAGLDEPSCQGDAD